MISDELVKLSFTNKLIVRGRYSHLIIFAPGLQVEINDSNTIRFNDFKSSSLSTTDNVAEVFIKNNDYTNSWIGDINALSGVVYESVHLIYDNIVNNWAVSIIIFSLVSLKFGLA